MNCQCKFSASLKYIPFILPLPMKKKPLQIWPMIWNRYAAELNLFKQFTAKYTTSIPPKTCHKLKIVTPNLTLTLKQKSAILTCKTKSSIIKNQSCILYELSRKFFSRHSSVAQNENWFKKTIKQPKYTLKKSKQERLPQETKLTLSIPQNIQRLPWILMQFHVIPQHLNKNIFTVLWHTVSGNLSRKIYIMKIFC